MSDYKAYVPRPTPLRPLTGLTVLLVEDSRFVCEAMRLMCLRSGARIRRADSLMSARRHLAIYRPEVLVIDVGLPDGSGIELMADMANDDSDPIIIGLSGDPSAEPVALAAGATAFLHKPLNSLAMFQETLLAHLPEDRHPSGPRTINEETVHPDALAFHDDLQHIAMMLEDSTNRSEHKLNYALQFLSSLCSSTGDNDLAQATQDLQAARAGGLASGALTARLAAVLHDRLSNGQPPQQVISHYATRNVHHLAAR